MDDLISRDFIKSLGGECIAARDSKTHGLLPISSIDALPSADVQPVVRCKDCVYWSNEGTRYCNMLQGTFLENDYCSYAERCTDE